MFPPGLLLFFRNNWQIIGAATACFFLVAYITILKTNLNAARARETALTVEIKAKDAEIKQWARLTAVQNEAIEQYNQKTAETIKRGKAAKEKAEKIAREKETELTRLKWQFEHIAPADDCESIKRVFNALPNH